MRAHVIFLQASFALVVSRVKPLARTAVSGYHCLSSVLNLRESAELKEAADAFENYLVDYARVTHMPQSVLSDICHLSVQAAHRGMEFCFMA